LTSVHPPTDTRIFAKECCTLAAAGHETHFIVPGAVDGVHKMVHIHGISKRGGRLTRMTSLVRRVYQKAKEIKADVYHFHDPELLPVGLLLKMGGKKVVYDVHEDVPRLLLSKQWVKKPLRKILSWFFERFENLIVKRLDVIVAATPHINQRFAKLGCTAVNINNYPILEELHLPAANWNTKERVICYIGGISKLRGIFEMIQALEQTEARLLLGGEFSPLSQASVAEGLPGWEKVDRLGQLDRCQVKQVLSRSMAGLVIFHPVPNHINAQPNKMFEYMSAGIPIITSDFPLWQEIVEGNQCGLCVDPLDPEKIAQAVNWILDHPDQEQKMCQYVRKAVEEKYNWDQEAQKLLQIYRELA
jgi:glycosyltransferase involved in cell wall biosynthesis